jgi:hypothetical protein
MPNLEPPPRNYEVHAYGYYLKSELAGRRVLKTWELLILTLDQYESQSQQKIGRDSYMGLKFPYDEKTITEGWSGSRDFR